MSMFVNRADLDAAVRTENAADWHAHQAIKAYRKKQWDVYRRHLRIADNLRTIERVY